jgi:hypothetical protein
MGCLNANFGIFLGPSGSTNNKFVECVEVGVSFASATGCKGEGFAVQINSVMRG